MKVKTIFASMVVLGLVSGTAFAAQQRGDMAGLTARANASKDAAASQGNLGKHVKVGAQLNIDGQWSNRTPDSAGNFQAATSGGSQSSSSLDVNNSSVSFDFMPSSLVDGHVELTGLTDEHKTVGVDEAYVTLGDLKKQPFYLSVGRMYRAFGYYGDANPLTKSFMQEMSETHGTTINVGYAQKCGFYGSGYVFKGALKDVTGKGTKSQNNHDNLNNGGLDAGYRWCNQGNNTGFTIGAGYINNILDTEAFAHAYSSVATPSTTYAKKVGGLALHAGGYYKQVDASVTFVGANKKTDGVFIQDGTGTGTQAGVNEGKGAKPYSFGAEVGYGFKIAGHESRAAVGYQRSKKAFDLGLPKSRVQADWTVGLFENTKLQLQYTHDTDYDSSERSAQEHGKTPAYLKGSSLSADAIKARLSIDLL